MASSQAFVAEMATQRKAKAATSTQPRVVSELTDQQLRHLLIAKLHPTVGVAAWGADRGEMLEMAREAGIEILSKADLEEVGPAVRTSMGDCAQTESTKKRIDRVKAAQQVGISTNTKIYFQLLLVVVVMIFKGQGGRQSATSHPGVGCL